MVLLTMAAVTAAGGAAYAGGKATLTDVKKRLRRKEQMKEHNEDLEILRSTRELQHKREKEIVSNMTAEERLQRFKKNNPHLKGRDASQSTKKKGLFGSKK